MGVKFILMGDFNSNYLNMNEQSSLDTILTPYNLQQYNKSVPTMEKFTSLIHYIIPDYMSDTHRTKIFKTYLEHILQHLF